MSVIAGGQEVAARLIAMNPLESVVVFISAATLFGVLATGSLWPILAGTIAIYFMGRIAENM